MTADEERRVELGGFLRKRRESLVRADYDLAPVGRQRMTGLRREEVAYHASVSVTWYTWLEQGREINPSRQVLDAIAHTMRLTAAEHEYVLALAGYAPVSRASLARAVEIPSHIQRLLDAHAEGPAFALAPDWSIAGWNRAYTALYPHVATAALEDRNLLVAIFTDPYVRSMLPDWEVTSAQFLAEYRAEAGPSIGQPAHAALIDRLRHDSAEFERAWSEHRVTRFASRERRFVHPDAGELRFEHHRLTPTDVPELRIVVYLPVDAGTTRKLRRLLRAKSGPATR
jgi:transcriptional regulator with XRE-family HTH domain